LGTTVISEARTTSKPKKIQTNRQEQYNSHTDPCTVYVWILYHAT